MFACSVTGLIEAAGYAAIVYLTVQSGKTDIYGAYVVSQVFIILSPNLLQGTDYWTVGKVLQLSGLAKNRKLLQKKAITGIFVTADLVALL